MRNFVILLLCICIVSATLSECEQEPFSYTFRQDRDNIEKVEICSYQHEYDRDGGIITPLVELPENDIDSLLADIRALECTKFVMLDPVLSYGDIVIAITYLNGEIEMIGIYNIGWISPDRDLTTTSYRFGILEMRAVIAKYADEKLLAEYSGEFR